MGDIVWIADILRPIRPWHLLPLDDSAVVGADIHDQIARVVQWHAELVQNVPECIVPCPPVVTPDPIEI